MKRVLAALVAVVLIGAGFFAHAKRTDPERGRAPLQLWCVADAASVCQAVQSKASGRVVVTIASPLQVEPALAANKPIDAIVTSPAWIKSLDDQSRLRVQTPLASAAVVVAQRSGATGCVDLTCLVEPKTRAALPKADTLAASIVAAGGIKDKTEEEIPSQIIEHLRAGGAGTAGFDPLTALVNAGLIAAVVTLKPSTGGLANVTVRPVSPSASLELDLGWITEDPRLDDLGRRLTTEFRRQGWDASIASPPGPDSTATLAAYGILNR